MNHRSILSALCLFVTSSLIAQTLKAPQTVDQGGMVSISHSGATDPSDYVTIVRPDAPDYAYKGYRYCRDGSPLTLRAPVEIGEYEVRLNRESNKTVLARSLLKVVKATISLTAPDEVSAMQPFQVSWEGPNHPGDYITLVKASAGARKYNQYVYTQNGSPITLTAPSTPGDYEIRYGSGNGDIAIYARPIKVKGTSASLSAIDRVNLGETFAITWDGPNNDSTYITIVTPDANDGVYTEYQYTRAGNPVKLKAPERPGTYEIRYNNERDTTVLARRPLIVDTVPVSIEAPTSVNIGKPIEITWEGPANQGDFITIVAEGAREGAYEAYVYVADSNPVQLKAPEAPGAYEIRYASGGKYYTLASHKIEVIDGVATLKVPSSHEAGQPLKVEFTGPNNETDYLAIVKAEDDPSKYLFYTYTREGNPATLRTPFDAGKYKVYYQLGRSGRILAEAQIELTATNVPGRLVVTAPEQSFANQKTAVAVILDASGSMLKRDGGTRRIQVAKQAVTQLVSKTLPAGTPFALRVFGHRQPNACQTDLEIPLAPLDAATASKTIQSIQAMNLAKTPIGASLAEVANDLSGHEGRAIVVLITDGEETCDGDTRAAMAKLQQAGFDVQVNIVGFALDEMGLKQTFNEWAKLGGGRYFDAAKATDLAEKLVAAVTPSYQVLDSAGAVVFEGEADGKAVSLMAGEYQIKGSGNKSSAKIKIEADTTTRHTL